MITGYIVERCEDGTDKWLRCNARLCPDLFYKVDQLKNYKTFLTIVVKLHTVKKTISDSVCVQLFFLFQVLGLKYGTKYNYRVFAENAAGLSKPTNIIGPLLADDPHGEHCPVGFINPSQPYPTPPEIFVFVSHHDFCPQSARHLT